MAPQMVWFYAFRLLPCLIIHLSLTGIKLKKKNNKKHKANPDDITHTYPHKHLRKIEQSSISGWQPILLVAWCLIWWFAIILLYYTIILWWLYKTVYEHTWHLLSVLRPGVFKNTQNSNSSLCHCKCCLQLAGKIVILGSRTGDIVHKSLKHIASKMQWQHGFIYWPKT